MKKKIIFGIIIVLLVSIASYFIYESHKDYVMEVYNFKMDNSDNIYAELYRPRTGKNIPLVIYSHGLGATYRAGIDYGKELTKYGVATLTIDFRGGSDRSKSSGKTTDMSFKTEIDDLEFVLEKVKEWKFIDKDKIVLMGSSQGGAISALVSAEHSDLKAAVLLYPALSIPSYVQEKYNNLDEIKEEIKMTDKITVGRKYFEDIWDMDVYSIIAKDNKPILIIQGTDDNLVSPEHSQKVNELYQNSKLFMIEGAGHGFDGEDFNKVISYIVDFFKDINLI